MAVSIRDIKIRINATNKTSQITNALNMVSASKLRRSEKKLLDYKDYMSKIEGIVNSVYYNCEDEIEHIALKERIVKKRGYIVLTSDRGLAGSFNNGLLKALINDIDKVEKGNTYCMLAIGSRAFTFLKNRKDNLLNESIINFDDEIDFDSILSNFKIILDMYFKGEIEEIIVYYNKFNSVADQEINKSKLLPLKLDESKKDNLNFDYEKSEQDIIDVLLPNYINNLLYNYLLNSKASEHSSRMTAMSNATDNANNVIKELNKIYNRARQTAITLELTDIIGGASAVE